MNLQPQQLRLVEPSLLEILWSDGQLRRYAVGELREHCPCASCLEKRSADPPPMTSLPIITTAEAQPLRITKMEPAGHYAYAIHFSDGHDTGIYTLELLRKLGQVVEL